MSFRRRLRLGRRVASMGHLGPWPLPRSLGSYYLSQGSGTGLQFLSRIPRVLPARKKFGPSPGKILATPLPRTHHERMLRFKAFITCSARRRATMKSKSTNRIESIASDALWLTLASRLAVTFPKLLRLRTQAAVDSQGRCGSYFTQTTSVGPMRALRWREVHNLGCYGRNDFPMILRHFNHLWNFFQAAEARLAFVAHPHPTNALLDAGR